MRSSHQRSGWQKACCCTGVLLVTCGCLLVAARWLPASIIGATSLEDPPSAAKTPNPSIAVSESLSIADWLVYHHPYWAGVMPTCIVASIGVGIALLSVHLLRINDPQAGDDVDLDGPGDSPSS